MDKKYWDSYYIDHHAKSKPTSFAKSIIETIEFPEVVEELNDTLLKKLEATNV